MRVLHQLMQDIKERSGAIGGIEFITCECGDEEAHKFVGVPMSIPAPPGFYEKYLEAISQYGGVNMYEVRIIDCPLLLEYNEKEEFRDETIGVKVIICRSSDLDIVPNVRIQI